ncbi:MAG: HD domain-containing protein [Planctomycetaceae bacterium]
MPNDKQRRRIVFEAARLMYHRQESEYYRAKMKAARKVCQGWVKPSDLPSNAEIRAEIQRFSWMHEGDDRHARLRDMRIEALRIMRLLTAFRPKIIGSTLTGHIREGSDIDIHAFATSADSIAGQLEQAGLVHEVERKRVRKHGEERLFTHVHVEGKFPIEVTVYAPDKASYVFKSSITGKGMERMSLPEFEQFLAVEYPDVSLDAAVIDVEAGIDRFQVYRALLLPLARVKQDRRWHPEGDALYHSLQVFELARDALPYDEEFLLAALLHDVGKAIDPHDHVAAGLEALHEFITERTGWLILHHMEGHALRDGTLGARARRRLQHSENFEELLLLAECDEGGREPGVQVPEVEECLDYVRELALDNG